MFVLLEQEERLLEQEESGLLDLGNKDMLQIYAPFRLEDLDVEDIDMEDLEAEIQLL